MMRFYSPLETCNRGVQEARLGHCRQPCGDFATGLSLRFASSKNSERSRVDLREGKFYGSLVQEKQYCTFGNRGKFKQFDVR